MSYYDLCLGWNTEWDADFAQLLDTACRARGLSPLLQITPVNIEHMCSELVAGNVAFGAYLDRAVEEDARFMAIVDWAREHNVFRINPYERAARAWDKAATHLDLFSRLKTPYTIILPPYEQQPELGALDLSPLGPTFTTKPSHGGGGAGVMVLCTVVDEIQQARQQWPADQYLLQERIVPTRLGPADAWFRVVYSAGRIYPWWWNTDTHAYTPVSAAEVSHYRLEPLSEITRHIAEVSGLHLFSTEIALNADNEFLVVDYVNDPIDLTLESKRAGGVTDEIVEFIANDVADLVVANRQQGE